MSAHSVPALRNDSLEIDELVARFRFKRHSRYLWVAASRLTRQVLGFVVGDHSERSLRALWAQVPAAYRRKLVYTDENEAPRRFLRERRCIRGKPGEWGLAAKKTLVDTLNLDGEGRIGPDEHAAFMKP